MPETQENTLTTFIFKCPGCEKYTSQLDYSASTYGSEWGTITLTENGEIDHNYSDHDNNETNNYEYQCPNCEERYSITKIKENSKWIKYTTQWPDDDTLQELYETGKTTKSNQKKKQKKPIFGATLIIPQNNKSEVCNISEHGHQCPKCKTLSAKNIDETATCVECGHEYLETPELNAKN